jgi:hypothetical protein
MADPTLDNNAEARHREMLGLLGSIRDTMSESTGLLVDIRQNGDDAEASAEAESRSAAKSRAEESVTDGNGGIKGIFNGVVGGVQGAIKDEGGKFGMLKKLGMAAMLLPFLDGFITEMVDDVKKSLFGDDEDGKKAQKSLIEESIGTGGMYALIGGFLNKRLILPGFFAGVFSEIFKDLEGNRYVDQLGLDEGQKKAIGLAVGGALGLAVPALITRAIPAAARGLTTGAMTTARGFAAASAASANMASGIAGQAGRTVPAAMRVNSAGRVVNATTGRFTSVADFEKAMKSTKRAAKLAKYAKFLKFLKGGALAVLPSLIDVVMAIYNDEPEDVVKKELAGVLGAAGGLAIGTLGGMAAGTAIFPGVGTLIGGFLGGTIGALSGEALIEKISNSLISGEDADPKQFKSVGARRKEQRASLANRSKAPSGQAQLDALAGSSVPSNISPVISPTTDTQANIVAKTQAMTTPSGGFIDAKSSQVNNLLSGGNTNNQTNVGGSSTTFNIVNGSSNSLSNAPHLPVPQGF